MEFVVNLNFFAQLLVMGLVCSTVVIYYLDFVVGFQLLVLLQVLVLVVDLVLATVVIYYLEFVVDFQFLVLILGLVYLMVVIDKICFVQQGAPDH